MTPWAGRHNQSWRAPPLLLKNGPARRQHGGTRSRGVSCKSSDVGRLRMERCDPTDWTGSSSRGIALLGTGDLTGYVHGPLTRREPGLLSFIPGLGTLRVDPFLPSPVPAPPIYARCNRKARLRGVNPFRPRHPHAPIRLRMQGTLVRRGRLNADSAVASEVGQKGPAHQLTLRTSACSRGALQGSRTKTRLGCETRSARAPAAVHVLSPSVSGHTA